MEAETIKLILEKTAKRFLSEALVDFKFIE